MRPGPDRRQIEIEAAAAPRADTREPGSPAGPSRETRRSGELHMLRVAGFGLILLAHFPAYGNLDYLGNAELYTVSTGLGLLFFVSGFAWAMRHGRMETAAQMLGFARKRVLRIMPLYWVALATFVVMFVVGKAYHSIDLDPLAPSLLIHAAALQVVFEPRMPAMFTLWFIGDIMLYYALFAFLARFAASAGRVLLLSALVLLLCASARQALGLFGNRFFIYCPVFILASGLALVAYAPIALLILVPSEDRRRLFRTIGLPAADPG